MSEPQPRPHLRCRLLGGFALTDAAGAAPTLPARMSPLLLLALALAPPQGQSREQLAGLLWAERSADRARHSLRQLLSAVRKVVPLRTDDDRLAFDPRLCSVDLIELLQWVALGSRDALARAVELYRGELLAGIEGPEWLERERRRIEQLVIDGMDRLVRLHLDADDAGAAAQVLRRWLALDPCAEAAARPLMQLLAATGDRAGALKVFQSCADALRRELDAAPGEATLALERSLRAAPAAGDQGGPVALVVLPPVPHGAGAGLDGLAAVLGEDLAIQLAACPGLRVIPAAAVQPAARDALADLRRFAQGLGVRCVVAGSLRRLDHGGLRLSVQLLDGASARFLATELHDLPPAPSSMELDDLVARIAGRLEQKLALAAAPAGVDPNDAWAALRQATGTLYVRGWEADAVREALRLYRLAAALDPAEAQAPARAQRGLIAALALRWGLIEGGEHWDDARADTEAALQLAPHASEVLGAAGCALADLGQPERALAVLERAVEQHPGNAQAWAAMGTTHLLLKRVPSGIELLRRGLRMAPADYRRSVWHTALASALASTGAFDDALAAAEAGCRADLHFFPPRLVQAGVLVRLGRPADARRSLAEARRLRPRLSAHDLRLWGGRPLQALDAGLTPPTTPD